MPGEQRNDHFFYFQPTAEKQGIPSRMTTLIIIQLPVNILECVNYVIYFNSCVTLTGLKQSTFVNVSQARYKSRSALLNN